MSWMLDTNIVIALIRHRPAAVLKRLTACRAGEVLLSSVTAAELWYGVERGQQRLQNEKALRQFLMPLDVVPFDEEAAVFYGAVRASLERDGTPIGPLDTMIAAHALSLGAVLVTNNMREFARVQGLRIEDWTQQ
ncbi:MAG: type II toxin-antitoxin system tRNA(fMet)-specific endonuclease VapC [Anaerolineae bacterium]